MNYDIHEVPPRGGESSRFALASSPTGISTTPTKNITNCYGRGLNERLAEAQPLQPPAKDLILRRVVRVALGVYELSDCRPLRVIPTAKPIRTGRFAKLKLRGGAFLDDLFLGGDAWHQSRDEDIYQAALRLAEGESFGGSELRSLNELVALAVLARAGVTTVAVWDLPF